MSSSKTVNEKCCICSKLLKKTSGIPKRLLAERDIVEFSTAFNCDFVTGDVVCGYCRVEMYKRRKIDFSASGQSSEDESESATSEMLEKTESSLSHMTLSSYLGLKKIFK